SDLNQAKLITAAGIVIYNGNIYFVDSPIDVSAATGNGSKIRRIDENGIITTVAGKTNPEGTGGFYIPGSLPASPKSVGIGLAVGLTVDPATGIFYYPLWGPGPGDPLPGQSEIFKITPGDDGAFAA